MTIKELALKKLPVISVPNTEDLHECARQWYITGANDVLEEIVKCINTDISIIEEYAAIKLKIKELKGE